MCPFLVAVVNDRLWQRPTGVYCLRPGGRVRLPARSTLARICTTPEYRTCASYRVSAAERRPAAGAAS